MHFLPILGGQSTYIENLEKVFEKSGYSVSVLQKFTHFKRENVKHIVYIPRLNRIFDSWFIFNWQLLFYRKFIKKFDIIISHYPIHYSALKWHKKVIVLSHGLDWHDPPITKVDKYREFAARKVKYDHAYLVANDTNFLRYLGYEITESTRYFEKIDAKTWFIPNCVDIEMFRNFEHQREKLILVPRTVRPERGIHLAIQAFSNFLVTNQDYKMEIVGIFNPKWSYYQHCVKLVNQLGLSKSVKFLNAVEWEKLPEFYNRASITLIPTVEKEGTSLSALESMSCGTPTISTNEGGLCDIPTLKSSTDPNDIASKMEYTIKNWNDISNEQWSKTRETFNLINWAKVWQSVIEEVNSL